MKTKDDFARAGAALALAGKPFDSKLTGWQGKAFHAGYHEAVTMEQAKIAIGDAAPVEKSPERPTRLIKVWTVSRSIRDARRIRDAIIGAAQRKLQRHALSC